MLICEWCAEPIAGEAIYLDDKPYCLECLEKCPSCEEYVSVWCMYVVDEARLCEGCAGEAYTCDNCKYRSLHKNNFTRDGEWCKDCAQALEERGQSYNKLYMI